MSARSEPAGYIYLLPMVIILLFRASRLVFNLWEPYKTAARYNTARTAAVDYPMKSWDDEIKTASKGCFSRTDYKAVTN